MNRRVFLVLALVFAFVGARLIIGHGTHSALAARTSAPNANVGATAPIETAAPPAADPTPSPSASVPEPATPAPVSESLPTRPAPAVPQAGAPGIPDVDPRKTFGSKSAPVAIEIFSDFQCPACKNLYMTTNRQLMDNYVSTGKVFLIPRDFPLPMHAYSRVAARYGRAAAQIGKFEAVEHALFQNQEKWEKDGDVDGTVAAVLSAAEMAKVRAMVKNGSPESAKLDAAIEKDIALGRGYNVSQTPTSVFHAKGQTYPYSGGMSYDLMKQFIDQLLAH